MLEQIRVRGDDYRGMGVANALLSYEHVESENYLVLHRVQIEINTDCDLLLDCPIDDDVAREHFENMLSVAVCNMDVKSEVTA